MKSIIVAAALAGVLASRLAAQPGASPLEPDEGLQATVEVAGIDRSARIVTFAGPDGQEMHIGFPPEVRDFERLKVGSRIRIHYLQMVDFPGEETSTLREKRLQRLAGKDAGPGQVLVVSRRVTATVQGIDRDAGQMTARLPDGNTLILKTGSSGRSLEQVHIGDVVNLRYTEAVALQFLP